MKSGTANPLLGLKALGQSVWLDDIQRGMIEDGSIARLIADDGLAGITSNPAIFHKAITQHHDYDAAIGTLVRRGLDASAICEALAIGDVTNAANLFARVYKESSGSDGFVSLEVSPRLAHDTEATVAEAQRLWARVARPNLMIKVPATLAGLPAVRRLIGAGINVNITLLFSVVRYRDVAEAYLAGLEDRIALGQPVAAIASVASFFLSRIDTLVDSMLDRHGTVETRPLRGQAAIACARLAYQEYKTLVEDRRWQALAARGARPQRLLWASTSAKDPSYPDVKYVEPLIGPETVNTLPQETLAAYRDHGNPALRLEDDLEQAKQLPSRLAALGIDLDAVAEQLEDEGVRKFIEPQDKLLSAVTAAIRLYASRHADG